MIEKKKKKIIEKEKKLIEKLSWFLFKRF